MRRILQLTMSIMIASQCYSANIMYIFNTQVQFNDTANIRIKISNDDPFIAFQLDIVIPDQFTYIPTSLHLDPGRSVDHLINSVFIQPQVLRIFAYSLTNTPFVGDTGTVATFLLSSGYVPGIYTMTIQNPIIGGTNSQNILTGFTNGVVTLLAANIYLNTETINFGNVPFGNYLDKTLVIKNTGNQNLQIQEVSVDCTLFSIMGPTSFMVLPDQSYPLVVRFNALSKGTYLQHLSIQSNDPDQSQREIQLNAICYTVNELHTGNISSFSGEDKTLTFSINNMESFVGFQFDLLLPGQLNYLPGSVILSSRKTNHLVQANLLQNNKLRIIAFSPDNQFFQGDSGVVVSAGFHVNGISGTYPLSLSQVVIGNENGQNILSASYSGVLIIHAPDISCPTMIDYGNIAVNAIAEDSIKINNIGLGTLTINQIQFSDTAFYISEILPIEILQGNFKYVKIYYSPYVKGEFAETMTVYSNDPDQGIVAVDLTGLVFYPNVIYAGEIFSCDQDTVDLFVSVDNFESFIAFQFDLVFPDILTCILDSITLTDRSQGHVLMKTLLSPTRVRIIAYSLDQNPFLGMTGPIVHFTFIIKAMQPGIYPLVLENAILSNSQSQNILYSVLSGNLVIDAPDILCADLLDYGNILVNVLAIDTFEVRNVGSDTLIVNQIEFSDTAFYSIQSLPVVILPDDSLSLSVQYLPYVKGGVNETMTILSNDPDEDVVNIELTGFTAYPNTMYVEDVYCSTHDTIDLFVSVDNYEPFIGFQFDLIFPDIMNCLLDSVSLTGRAQDHELIKILISPTQLRIIASSPQQAPFLGNSGSVVHFSFAIDTDHEDTYPLQLENTTLVDTLSQNILYAALNGTVFVYFTWPPAIISIEPNCFNVRLYEINDSLNLPMTIFNEGLSDLAWDIDTNYVKNYALDLDGSNDYVSLGNNPCLNLLATDSFTIVTWVKPDNLAASYYPMFFDKYSQANGKGFSFGGFSTEGTVSLFISTGYNPNLLVKTQNTLPNQVWTQLAVTYDGSKNSNGIKIYFNSIQQSVLILDNGLAADDMSNNVNAQIGGRNGPNYCLNGSVDETSFWHVVLSQNEIESLMIDPGNLPLKGLIGYWRLDEGSGTNTTDLSGNNNHGLITGGPIWIESGINLPGYFGYDYSAFTFVPTSGTTSPGDSSLISVTFRSDSLPQGSYQSAIRVNSNDIINDTYTVPVEVTIDFNVPDILCPDSIDYGEVIISTLASESLEIKNVGLDTLLISQIEFSDTAFSIDINLPVEIPPGDSNTLTVSFSPYVKGDFTETMTIHSNDPNESYLDVILNGSAYYLNTMYVEDVYCSIHDTIDLFVSVDNFEPFVGFQFDLVFPDIMACLLDSISLTERAQDHILIKNLINPTRVRIISFSLLQTPFLGTTGPIVHFSFVVNTDHEGNYPLMLESAILADSLSQNILQSVQNGTLYVYYIWPPPVISILPDSFNVELYGSNDSITLPLTIKNIGLSDLTWEIDTNYARNFAINLDGSNDFINLGNNPSLNLLATDSFSIVTWVKPDNLTGSPYPMFFDKYSEATGKGFSFCGFGTEGTICLFINSGVSNQYLLVKTQNILPSLIWTQVAVTYNGSKNANGIKIYFNGIEQSVIILSNSLISNDMINNVSAQIGARNGPNYRLDGSVDETSFWNVVLNQNEIQSLMNNLANPPLNGLIGYWRFDEGVGTNTTDLSGFNNNGLLVGAPIWIESGVNLPGYFEYDYTAFTFNPISGTTSPSDSSIVNVTFRSDLLLPGLYQSEIRVNSNDNSNSFSHVPVTITIYEQLVLNLKAFLEGPFNQANNLMNTNLISISQFPFNQPYGDPPWNYAGSESIQAITNPDIVDWVLIEVRDAPSATQANINTRIARQAAFILKNGTIVSIDGSSYLEFNNSINQSLFVVLWHRNHLPVLSANPLVEINGVYTYDFSVSIGQVFGLINGHKMMVDGIWGLMSGDGNADKQVNNSDKIEVWRLQAGFSGYYLGDFNLSGLVDNIDKIDKWLPNSGKSSQVP